MTMFHYVYLFIVFISNLQTAILSIATIGIPQYITRVQYFPSLLVFSFTLIRSFPLIRHSVVWRPINPIDFPVARRHNSQQSQQQKPTVTKVMSDQFVLLGF